METHPPKTCTICGETWQPMTRYQATRNKTCGPACAAKSISHARTGQPSPLNQKQPIPCAVCGTIVLLSPSRVKRVQQPTCSRQCNGIIRSRDLIKHSANGKGKKRPGKGLAGENNPAWKGGVTYFRKHGNYKPIKYVRCPVDLMPMSRADGYVMEHRLIMARMSGYCLTRTEVVHHIDHDPQNNESSNLELWPTNQSHKMAEHGRCAIGAACRFFPKDSAQP